MLIFLTLVWSFGVIALAIALGYALRRSHSATNGLIALGQNLLSALERSPADRQLIRSQLVKSKFFSTLLEWLDSSTSRRLASMEVLSQIDGPEVVPPLLSQLGVQDSEIRNAAMTALSRIRDPSAVGILIANWPNYPSNLIEEALVLHGPSVISLIGPVVGHSNPVMRQGAIRVLERLGSANALPYLIDALGDPETSIRTKAAASLGSFGQGAVRPLDISLRNDPSIDVRLAAAHSLRSLKGPEAIQAIRQAFLTLSERYFPRDSSTALWAVLTENLNEEGELESSLQRVSSLPIEMFASWLRVGVFASDLPTLLRLLKWADARTPEVLVGIGQIMALKGEEFLVGVVTKIVGLPGAGREGAIVALESLMLSPAAKTRIATEIEPKLKDLTETELSKVLILLRRWSETITGINLSREGPSAEEAARKDERDAAAIETHKVGLDYTAIRQPAAAEPKAQPFLPHVFLVDDNERFRKGLRSLLEREGFKVLAEAGSLREMEGLMPAVGSGAIVFCSESLPGHLQIEGWLLRERPSVKLVYITDASQSASFPQGRPKYEYSITRDSTEKSILDVTHRAIAM